tara:strand:+ start:435 stop:728 length:294 start_codon:yes stop_codon:yes gene_type:complete
MKKILLIFIALPMIGFASFPVQDNVILRDTCDKIVLHNGNEILTKVIEIDSECVKYKYCNNIKGPIILVLKKYVKMITYADRNNEVITITYKMPINV